MKYIYKPLLVSFLFSCANPGENNHALIEKKVRHFVSVYIQDSDSTSTVDSVRLLKIDTLTMKDRLLMKYNHLADSLERSIAILKAQNEITGTQIRLAKLASGLSKTLFEKYRDDARDGVEQAGEYREQMDRISVLLDTLRTIVLRSDSVKPVDFEAKFIYQVRRRDGSVNKDTGFVFLNAGQDIVRKEDYYRELYKF